MNTQQLECFIQVAEHLNFARAARELHLTQPAVSRQIQSLEEELGTRLFHRTTKSVTLTASGNIFSKDAGGILDKMRSAAAKVHHGYQGSLPVLSIGCYDSVDLTCIPNLLRRLRKVLPNVRPDIHVVPHRYILDQLLGGSLDVMLGFREDMPLVPGISYQELAELACCCVVPAGHPFAEKAEITEEELLTEALIACTAFAIPSSMLHLQERLQSRFAPSSVCFCDRVQVAASLIRAGFGFAILPELKLNPDTSLVSISIVGTTPSSYGLFYRTDGLSVAVQELLACSKG